MPLTFCPIIEIEDQLGPEAFAVALGQFIDQWCAEVGASSEELIDALFERTYFERRRAAIANGE